MNTFIKKDFDFWQWGAFFAFDNETIEKERWWTPREKLINLWMWLIAMKSNYKEMMKDFDLHNKNEIERRKKEIWIDNIIIYELNNYEVFYSWDLEEVFCILKQYWIEEKKIIEVYEKEFKRLIESDLI